MTVMRGWRAWYAVTRTEWVDYSCTDWAWQDLPPEGMVGVVMYLDPPYRRIIDGGDWYWLEGGVIRSLETHHEWGKFVDPPKVACVSCLKKSGVLKDDAWALVRREMMAAKEIPTHV